MDCVALHFKNDERNEDNNNEEASIRNISNFFDLPKINLC